MMVKGWQRGRGFVNHLSVGQGPVTFGQDQLISAVAGLPKQLIFMFIVTGLPKQLIFMFIVKGLH